MRNIVSMLKICLSKPVSVMANLVCLCFPNMVVYIRYWLRLKKWLHLNNPKDLNEKILWLALNTDTTEWSRLSDKCAVRDYVKDCGLSEILVRQYKVWDDAETLTFDDLPNEFVLKTTYGTGVKIVKNKDVASLEEIKCHYERCQRSFYITSSVEKHYLRIPRRIIADELLHNDEISKQYSDTLIDYKVWCMDGKAHFIFVCKNRDVRKKHTAEFMIYDRNWNPHPEYCIVTSHFSLSDVMPTPIGLDEMLLVAERLAKPFPLVRVDLYNLAGKIYFGEMTFTSLGGMMDFYSPKFLLKCGELVHLPRLSK